MKILTPEELESAFPLLTVFVFAIGACVGSFLNVVVYRLPHGESLITPASHCPKCGQPIKAWDNIPIFSWLLLRGRCRYCRQPIAVRYPLVELATALLYLAVWLRVNALGLPYAILPGWFFLIGALLAVTITDLESRMITDKVTYTGMMVAVFLAAALPQGRILWIRLPGGTLLPATSESALIASWFPAIASHPHLIAPIDAIGSLAVGWSVLWSVRKIGDFFWGRHIIRFGVDTPLTYAAGVFCAGQQYEVKLTDIPRRRSQELLRARVRNPCIELTTGETLSPGTDNDDMASLSFRPSVMIAGKTRLDLDSVKSVKGQLLRLDIPREVLGGGDIKLLAMIASFLGLGGMFFTLMLSSVTGFLVGLSRLILNRGAAPDGSIAYGPFLACSALLWLFAGPEIWHFWEKFVQTFSRLLAFI